MNLRVARVVCVIALLPACRLRAEPVSVDDALGQLGQSALEEIDVPALAATLNLDERDLQSLCRELQERLQGEHVLELAPLREMATGLLPVLDQHKELKPYAAWLRARLDYLVVADELRVAIPPPRLVLPPAPVPLPPLNPSPELERQVWQAHVKQAPEFPGAKLYVPRLKPIFAEEGVPAELVWLAEVESGFDPLARSPTGAIGLFQLMPDTARSLGLTVGMKDQRLDPMQNARSSARYLKYLYGKFNDWRLAVAAYNAGEGCVRRLLEKHAARSYDEIALHLPAETQMYVPKVEATIQRREGVTLASLKPR